VNIYIDAGFYCGQSLELLEQAGAIDDTWTMYAFDPNPDVTEYFEKFPKVKFIRKALWTKNGTIKFWVAGRFNAAHIDGTSSDSEDSGRSLRVPCIDFSDFVRKLPDATIICSMDIEGAEFDVLNKMIDEGTIDRISELWVEFHHRLMKDKGEDDATDIIKKLNEHGVRVRLKERLR
jgi:FkbM family methyltransferase